MNRIDQKFSDLKQKNEKALVGFLTAGDPDYSRSLEIISAMCDAGLDILELGVPFSDPTADGPVIQRSSARSLAQGMNVAGVLRMTAELRRHTGIPIVLFSYYNPIHAFGVEAFHRAALSSGADGVLVVDLPLEESAEMTSRWPDDRLSLIRLVAPTTPPQRMARINETAAGFLYLVSKTGVTGSAGVDWNEIRTTYATLHGHTTLPVCIGFGIASAEDVATVASIAEGVVIGSAFERMIEENLTDPARLPSALAEKVRLFKAATRKS